MGTSGLVVCRLKADLEPILYALNEKGVSLMPGAYVGVAPAEDDGVDFAQRMKEIHKELLELQAESNRLMEISRFMALEG